MPSPSPPGGGSLCRVTAPRLLPLFLGVCGGGFVSLGVALSGVRSAAAVRWLLRLPGDLLLSAFVCLALPATALHATRVGSDVARVALKLQTHRWLQLAGTTLAVFALSTLLASLVGALLAVALQSIVPTNTALTQVWGLQAGATVSLACPGAVANGSVALQPDGTLKCAENATTFVIDDVARTFVVASTVQASSVLEQFVKVTESVFPESLGAAFVYGDVLSLLVGGIALGAALTCYALTESEQSESGGRQEEQPFLLLQLVVQTEALACQVLSWLQKYLPMTVAFMISSVLLQSSTAPVSSDDTDNTVVAAALALMAVVLLALVIDVVVMIFLAAVFTRSNPFAFLEHLLPALLLALSSGSPLVSLPATVSCVVSSKRVSPTLAFIVCASSTVLNQTGTALYLSVSSLFVLTASSPGMNSDELAVTQSASTVTAMIFANTLIAGVVSPLPTGSKTVALATTLGAVYGVSAGPRAALLTCLAALEWITGPFVACVNVTNNTLVALVVAHYFETPQEEPATEQAEAEVSRGPAPESEVPDLRRQRVMGMIHSENWV
ncbi:Neutral amino acid transporter B(0) [Phytophthora citrophthora]|uniref:Amino acid transporter n=1 Tax=Phytophthora citrophthora TaxID=4793 RepID=A0AAD9LB03_9STRA|nr:Neutral amino acid transporter B(0) [Phytophthora citrophthora]